MVRPEVEKILQELLNEVKTESVSSKSTTDKEIEFAVKERDMIKERAGILQARLIQANQKVNLLSDEVTKRNEKLRILSEAFRDLQSKYDSHDSMLRDMREGLSQRDNTIRILKMTLEKNKKQSMNNNLYLESVYKKIAESERKYEMAHVNDKKLRAEMDRLTEMLKAKDLALIKRGEDTRHLIDEEKTRLKMKYENEMEEIWQKERMLRSTIAKLNQELMAKDSMLATQKEQLINLVGIQDRIKQFIETRKSISPEPIRPNPIPTEHAEKKSRRPLRSTPHTSAPMSFEVDEIIPMIKVAMQHGDSDAMIKQSLVSSGYDEEEVEKAIEKTKSILS